MLFSRYLSAFNVYIIILILLISFLISGLSYFSIVNFLLYSLIHILLIYTAIYHYRFILYFVYFITGMIFDIFLLDEIGPHIIIFMILIPTINRLKKVISNLSSSKIFVFIILLLFLCLILEMIISYILFNIDFNVSYLLKNLIISIIISYPTFYFFSKIDKIG